MRIFLISPVRDMTHEEWMALSRYVMEQTAAGHRVHWPHRDTDQTGDGVAICAANLARIEAADEVHVWWNPRSYGSHFDLGIAYALGKRIVLARPVAATQGKSFANVLRSLAGASAS